MLLKPIGFMRNPPAGGGGYSGPTVFSVGTSASGTSNYTQTAPTHAANDIGLVMMCNRGAQLSSITDVTWTQLPSMPVERVGASSTNARMNAYWKRAGSSSDLDVTIQEADQRTITNMIVIRGCVTAGTPLEVLNTEDGTATSSISIPGAAVTNNNSLILMMAAERNVSVAPVLSVGFANGSLANVTEVTDFLITETAIGGAIYSGELETATTIGASTATLGTSGDEWAGAVIAMIPA